jgi:putative hydrolase of the HAD superfamily
MKCLIIFDVDGVLVDDVMLLPERKRSFFKALAERRRCSMDEAKALFKMTKERMPEDRRHTTAYVFQELGFTREEFFSLLNAVAPEGLAKGFPDAEWVLQELSVRHRLVLYSNTPAIAVESSLSYLGLRRFFSALYAADGQEISKPSPVFLRRIIEKEGFTPSETVVVGDSLEKDVLPAVAVGAKGVLFDPQRKRVAGSKDYLTVRSFAELLTAMQDCP